MNVKLIFPPISTFSGFPPCGLSALSSFLKRNKIDVETYDLNVEFLHYLVNNWESISEEINDNLYDRILDDKTANNSQNTLKYYIQVIIPLINNLKNQKNSKILHRNLEELINFFLFDDLLQKNNYSSNLKAPLSDVILRVRENCENTTIINFINLHSWEKCDFIGFSLISEQQLPYAMLFAQKIREKVPYAKFIAGGPYITEIFPNLVNTDLIFDFFDYLVVHEGETAILNIINHEKNKYPLLHPNIFSLKNRDNIKGPFLLEDVQVFNEQDFSSLNLDYYKIWEERGLPVYSSKGCTWCKCSFCSQNNILKYREMEVSYFIDKIRKISHETGITRFQISDEDIRPSRLKEMAEEIIKRSLKIEWSVQTRFYPILTRDLLKELYASGCIGIEFGLESGSIKTLKKIKKGISLDVVRQILANCEDIGIHVILNCMIGFPFEEERDAEELISFLNEIQTNYSRLVFLCNTQVVKVYKNSDFGKNPEKYGIEGVTDYELSPTMDWDQPDWVSNFVKKYSNHILLSERWSNTINISSDAPNFDHSIGNDPILKLSENWIYLNGNKHLDLKNKLIDVNDYLIQTNFHGLRYFQLNKTMSNLVSIICDQTPRLSVLIKRFSEMHSGISTEEVNKILGNGILLLNEKEAISFYES